MLQATQVTEIVVHEEEEVRVEREIEVQPVSLMQAQREDPSWLSPNLMRSILVKSNTV